MLKDLFQAEGKRSEIHERMVRKDTDKYVGTSVQTLYKAVMCGREKQDRMKTWDNNCI